MEQLYLSLLKEVCNDGEFREDRTGTGTLSKFGVQARYNIEHKFPLLTTKRVWFKGVLHELLWFVSGNTNIEYLNKNGVHIWDAWADESGNLGPVYGKQWRSSPRIVETDGGYLLESVDQLGGAIRMIKKNPSSRRIIVNAWNVSELDKMALPPCHTMYQFYVSNGKYLDLQLYQRSADMFLGVPFNIASYSLLLMMVAKLTNLTPRDFIHTIGDAHVYLNHLDQVNEQLSRDPLELPQLRIHGEQSSIDEFTYEDFELVGYKHHPGIKAPISV